MTEEQNFYSVPEFAKKLGVHPQTVRKAVKNGRINGFRVGDGQSRFRIPASEIQRLGMFDLKEVIKKIKAEDL